MGFILRGFIWDIPLLSFAYVLVWGPKNSRQMEEATGKVPKSEKPKPETRKPPEAKTLNP